MSFNQSRSDKSDSAHYRKSGRSASFNQSRTSSGAYGKGGAPATAPSPSLSSSANRSFKKPSNAQGLQSRANPLPPSPNLESGNAPLPQHNVQNGSAANPQLRGPSNSPLASTTGKPSGPAAAPHRGTQTVPKAPTSQSTPMISETTAPATPVKSSGDASAAFAFQFGSISPGFVNGMQIPARTSSAPPNIDEQRRDQARHDAAKIVPPVPVPPTSRPQLPRKDSASSDQSTAADANLIPKAKKDGHQVAPPAVQPQKPHVHQVPGTPIRMNFHQPQVPVHFNGPNTQTQSQVFPASSIPMPVPIHMPLPVPNVPQVQQQMFVPGIQSHPMQPQGIMHQGQNLGFAAQVNPQLSQLGNMGMGIGQYSQQQGGQFGGPRKSAVKITHPDTHQEVRLDKRSDTFSDGVPSNRSHPTMPPQSQAIPAYSNTHQINYFPNYNPGSVYFPPPLPLAGAQLNSVSQAPRFSYPIGQSAQNAAFVNSQASNLLPAGKIAGTTPVTIEQPSQDHVQSIRDAARVTIRQADRSGSENIVDSSSLRTSSAATNVESPKVSKLHECEQGESEACPMAASPKLKLEKESPLSESQSVITEHLSAEAPASSHGNAESCSSTDSSLEVSSALANADGTRGEKYNRSNSMDRVGGQSNVDNSHMQAEDHAISVSSVTSSTSCRISGATEGVESQGISISTSGLNEDIPLSGSESSSTNITTATTNFDSSDIVGKDGGSASSEISRADRIVESADSDLQVMSLKGISEVVAGKNEQAGVNCAEVDTKIDDSEISETVESVTCSSSSSAGSHGVDISSLSTTVNGGIMGNSVVDPADAEGPEKVSNDGDAKEGTGSKGLSLQGLVCNDKPAPELNRSKSTAARGKKKRKEILQKADAAGTTSDLYMAYKGPEGKKEAVVSSESAEVSSPGASKHPQVDAHQDETLDNEESVHSKGEPDDWEDAADISTPKLDASVSGKQPVLDVHDEDGSMAKKYSRDFLLKFAEQYPNLPEDFEITSDIADAFSPGVNMSRSVDRDSHPSPGRVMERRSGGPRLDRRGSALGDDDRWNKVAGAFGSGRDLRLDNVFSNNIGLRPGQGASHGVLRNPRPQSPGQYAGGILSGPMQSPGYQGGIQRNGSDADRWQRSTSFQQKGLFPSPQTPHQMMHKAEKKYEVGKATDEEQAKQRQLKAILNKLTPQNFEKLFEQVLAVNIDNATTLNGLISQIFDKALMEPTFCEMYANLCSHLSQKLPELREDDEKITFKRLLLNKCQEEFERGEREQEEANKVEEEGEVKLSAEEREEKRIKARRRMLGNIRLIGELYKKRMLTEKIMHECMKKLLCQYQTPDEEDLEALCKLMSTIGEMIDHPKAKEHMDAYFERMAMLSNNMDLSSRIRFMLKDAIDLRKNKWQQRRKVEGPKKIEEVHRDAAQERHAQVSRMARSPGMNPSGRRGSQMDFAPRGSSLSSPSSQVGGFRGLPSQARGFAAQDVRYEERQPYEGRTLSIPLLQRSTGDDSITLGPQGGLGRGMSVRGSSISSSSVADVSSASGEPRRTPVGLNSFSSVERTSYNLHEDSSARFAGDRNRGPASSDQWSMQGGRDLRGPDYGFDRSATSVQMTRGNGPSHAQNSEKGLSEERLRDLSMAAIKEYYSAKDEKEVALCIKDLNSPSYYPSMVSLWVTDSFERKDKERDLLTKLLVNLTRSHDTILSQLQLIQGFESVLTTLEDAVNDAPKAAEFLGGMFGKVIAENVVSLDEIGGILREGGEEPGQLLEVGLAADVLGSTLMTIESDKGETVLKEIRRSSKIRLEDFLTPGSSRSRALEKFI